MAVTTNDSIPFSPPHIRVNPDLIDEDEEGVENDNSIIMNGGGGNGVSGIHSAAAAASAAAGFDSSMSIHSNSSGNSGNNNITPSFPSTSRMSLSSSSLRASNGGSSPANTSFNYNNAVLPLSYYNHSSNSNSNSNNGNINPTTSFLITNPGTAATPTYTIKSIDSIKGHLLSLQDEHSTYMNVARACHFLNQFATHGGYNSTPVSSSLSSPSSSSPKSNSCCYSSYSSTLKVVQSSTINLSQYTQHMTKILSSLSMASTTHIDRRCRILAIQSLSTIAGQSLTKVLVSPCLYANRENEICVHRLQDEICNDVMVTLVHCALGDTLPDGDGIGGGSGMGGGLSTSGRNSMLGGPGGSGSAYYYEADDDDGVSAVALECIGKIVCTNDGGMSYDPLVKEILFLTGKQPMVKSTHLVPRRGLWDDGSGCGHGNSHGHRSYANYLQNIDINYNHYKTDLQFRILESILAPRARKLFIRACLYKCTEHKLRSLNILNDIMIFVYRTERARRGVNLGKDGFAKRWYEFDASMLIQEYVQLFLIPLLRKMETVDGSLDISGSTGGSAKSSSSCGRSIDMSMCVVMNSLMLCSIVTCKEVWSDQLIKLSIQNLDRALQRLVQCQLNSSHVTSSSATEMKSNLIAVSLVAMRGMHRNERLKTLLTVAEIITMIPSTSTVPGGSISLAPPLRGGQQRRKPSRVGYWTEIALAMLLPDGFSTSTNVINKTAVNTTKRKKLSCSEGASSTALNYFLSSNFAKSLFHSRSKVWKKSIINPAEEMVYVFCSVAYSVGKRIVSQILAIENSRTISDDSSHVIIQVNSESSMPENDCGSWIQMEYESWFRASLDLLNAFLPCLLWEPSLSSNSNSNVERSSKELAKATTFCCASQRSYVELLRVLLIASGMLSTTSSVFLHFMCSIPITIPDEGTTENFRLSLESNITTENDLKVLLDNLLLTVNTSGISRKIKISLLTLLSDTWIQKCKVMISASAGLQLDQKEIAGPVDIDEDVVYINEQQARELLSSLATEISQLLIEEKERNGAFEDSVNAGESMRYLMACIASVESIGYTAQLLANHFSESRSNTENEESAKHLVSVCTVVLKGQGKIEVEPDATNGPIESGNIVSNNQSPPRSPQSRARITAFTLECADAAKRLQNFVGYYDDVYSLGDNVPVIDFNCLCPLFKRPNFGMSPEDHFFTNDIWNLTDRFSLIQANDGFGNRTYGESATPSTKASLLQLRHHFKGDVYKFANQLQLYRQLLCHQVDQAIDSSPLHFLGHPGSDVQSSGFSLNPSQRMPDPLRLFVPPKSNECFAPNQFRGETNWLNNTFTISSGSDPLATTLSYAVQQRSRFDGDVEWGLVVTVVVHNVTAVPILSGVRVDATIFLNDCETPDSPKLLNKGLTETSLYKNELAPGDHFIWEFVLDSWLMGGQIFVKCALRGLETESVRNELLNVHSDHEEGEQNSFDNRNGDFYSDEEGEETLDVILTGRPVSFSLFVVLQPSPQVFYRDRCGDPVIFQFLWLSMEHCLPEIRLAKSDPQDSTERRDRNNNTFQELAISSTMDILCLDDCGETRNMTVWSFSTWCNKHILVAADVDVNKSSEMTLHLRGDDLDLLRYCAVSQKEFFISGLTSGKWCANC